jgi:hypothetical protein
MQKPDLKSLELLVDKLIAALTRLKLDNDAFKKKIELLKQENMNLLTQESELAVALKKVVMKLEDEL